MRHAGPSPEKSTPIVTVALSFTRGIIAEVSTFWHRLSKGLIEGNHFKTSLSINKCKGQEDELGERKWVEKSRTNC